jgi:hypothetical protein
MLDPAEARGPVENTPNDRRNPLVELPEPAEDVAARAELVLVTHLPRGPPRQDRGGAAQGRPPWWCASRRTPRRCAERGFTDARPVEGTLQVGGSASPARAGSTAPARSRRCSRRSPASSCAPQGEPTVYIAGDTIWCDEAVDALDEHRPDVVVVNASGARFNEGDPIVMTAEDVATVARHVLPARIVVVHLEAINHCLEPRSAYRDLPVSVPADGAEVPATSES